MRLCDALRRPPAGRRAAAALAAWGLLQAAGGWAASCNLSALGVAFGSYDPLSNLSVDSAGSITVSCSASTSYSIALSAGSGTLLVRQLQSASSALNYNLYTNALRTIIWGDGTSGTTLVSASDAGATYTVYGRIPGGQNARAGSYSDSVTVTLTF